MKIYKFQKLEKRIKLLEKNVKTINMKNSSILIIALVCSCLSASAQNVVTKANTWYKIGSKGAFVTNIKARGDFSEHEVIVHLVNNYWNTAELTYISEFNYNHKRIKLEWGRIGTGGNTNMAVRVVPVTADFASRFEFVDISNPSFDYQLTEINASLVTSITPKNHLTIDEWTGNVGVGTDSPKSKFHVSNGNSGGIAHGFSDLTIEDDDHAMINLLSPNNKIGYYGFSDTNDNYVGGMQYNHGSNKMEFKVNNHTSDMVIDANGNVGLGLGVTNPKAQLVIGSNFGASISGTTGGNAVFGTNLALKQGGDNHNKLFTPYSHTNTYGYAGVQTTWGKINFYTKRTNTTADQIVTPSASMTINEFGKVGIGTTTPDAKLTVNGDIHTKEVRVDLAIPAPDYVFKDSYDLLTIEEVQEHIQEKGHLPNIPSAKEMESNGVELGTMNMKLLEKIEELTLYTISQEKRIKDLEDKLTLLLKGK